MPKLSKAFWGVSGVLGFALLIRLWGVWHGLPYIYSVDEPALVHSVLGLRFDLNPHHFDWPHFHFYLSYLVFGIFYKARIAWQVWDWKPVMEAAAPILWNDGAIFYLLLRLLSVFMGALTVIPVFLASRDLLGTFKKALLAALLFAIIPFHVENSKYALIDVPATFWAAWSFYFAIRIFKKPTLWSYILAGVFGGLAASSKYNAVLILLMLLLVHLSRLTFRGIVQFKKWSVTLSLRNKLFLDWWKLVLGIVASIAAFFVGTPYALLDWKQFMRSDSSLGAMWQLGRGGNRLELPVFGRLIDSFANKLGDGFGLVALLIAVIGLVVAIRSKDVRLKVLSLFTILFYLYVGSSAFAPVQIFMPLYVALSLLFVVGVGAVLKLIRREFFESEKSWRIGFWLVVVLTVWPSFISALKVDYLYTFEDTRNLVKKYIDHNLPKGAVIGREGEEQPFYEGTHPTAGVAAWRYGPLSEQKIEYVVIASNLNYDNLRETREKYGEVIDNMLPIYMEINTGDRLGPNLYVYKVNYPLDFQWWLDESKVPPLTIRNILSTDHKWRSTVVPVNYITRMVVTGNWDFSGKVTALMQANNDLVYPVDRVLERLKEADIAVAFLENIPKDIPICNALNASGADVVFSTGTGVQVAEVVANNIRFGFVGIDPGALDFSESSITSSIKALREEKKVDVVVVAFDWLNLRPQEALTHLAVDSGADVVIGNSKEVEKIEVYKDKFISLGNGQFVSDKITYPLEPNYPTASRGVLTSYYFFRDCLIDVEEVAVGTGTYSSLTGTDCKAFVPDDQKSQADMREMIFQKSK